MNARIVSLLAGVIFLGLAAFVQGLLPLLEPQSRRPDVTKVVRTDLGELKWMRDVATNYTELQQLGRDVYRREGCWYCHSQYVRPVAGESRRWGPVAQAGEYYWDRPHLWSTRRIGPDVSRVGLKYSDEWHIAHFWNPRMVVRDSIMPRFSGLFEQAPGRIAVTTDDAGRRTLERNATSERFFDLEADDELLLTPNAEGLLYVHSEDGEYPLPYYPVIHTPNDEFTGEQVQLIGATRELIALVAYLQKLGTNRGMWRDVWEPQRISVSAGDIPRSEDLIAHGQDVYKRRCVGCHGVDGDGNGPAATFLYRFRPRDFTLAVFKFRNTPSGSLPTDGDLMRVVTRGVRGTAMPSWHMLPEADRLAVIQYIKTELAVDRSDPGFPWAYFEEEAPDQPIWIGRPPEPSADLVERGADIWQNADCWECHGDEGRGDGPEADDLEDDFGFPIRPANLTTGQFKSGPGVEDIFRTISTGLNGTPMPSYRDSRNEEERWALAYYVLSLSAYKDPLTGEELEIAEEDRAALNAPTLQTPSTRHAYVPRGAPVRRPGDPISTIERYAQRKGIEIPEFDVQAGHEDNLAVTPRSDRRTP
ncbi:MAG: cytochrome c [Aquisalimonadaceae bacterium]